MGAQLYVRARTCSLRTYIDIRIQHAQIIIGENLIWRFCDRSPNRQIKALAKFSRYTVCTITTSESVQSRCYIEASVNKLVDGKGSMSRDQYLVPYNCSYSMGLHE